MIRVRIHRRGIAFVITLWMIVVLTAIALAVGSGVRTERVMASNSTADARARMIERGALRYVRNAVDGSSEGVPTVSGDAVRIGDGAFWILAGDADDSGAVTYGLVDEGGKVDLNTAPQSVLEKLPGSNDEIAAAIIDWRDTDDEVTGAGAESDYYVRQDPSYEAHNGPFESVGELRMVAGVDAETLHGVDVNRDGVLDDDEESESSVNSDVGVGLLGSTTAWLKWPEEQNDNDVVAINTANRREIQRVFETAMDDDEDRAEDLAEDAVRQRPFATLFHLYYKLKLTEEEFTALEGKLSFETGGRNNQQANRFKLNVNTASIAVLKALPGLEEVDAQALFEARQSASGTSLAWMLDVIDEEKLLEAVSVGVTGQSYQYSADILSVSGDGRAFRRARYVIDVSGDSPRVVYRQDLTHLGWPLDREILTRLRSGEDLDTVLGEVQVVETTQ